MRLRLIGLAVSSAALVVIANVTGCSTGNSASPSYGSPQGAGSSGSVTFHKDVEPILQKNCQGCHVAGGIAPFTLTSYADAKTAASEMVVATSKRIMPPWGAYSSPDCTPTHGFQDDLRLSDQDIATISAWEAAGSPEGDAKDAPIAPVAAAVTTSLGNVSQSLTPEQPYDLTASSDQFRCFILDPKLTKTVYMNGSFIIAGNPQIVHHALIFADAGRESLANVADGSNQYDCFGGPGISSPSLVAAWAPGGLPQEFPSNIGMAIDPGTLFVMQVHYHPHATVTNTTDKTTFQIRYVDAPPEYTLLTQLIGNFDQPLGDIGGGFQAGLLPGPDDPPSGPAFLIPANTKGHTEEMEFVVPSTVQGAPLPDLYLYSVASHEHYVGTQQQITLEHTANFLSGTPGSQKDECLLNVPAWNFNWQRFYAYANDGTIEHLPRLGPGDKLHIKCTYDNTVDNPLLAESLHERQMSQPVDVKLGETTLDEMCLGGFSLVYKNP